MRRSCGFGAGTPTPRQAGGKAEVHCARGEIIKRGTQRGVPLLIVFSFRRVSFARAKEMRHYLLTFVQSKRNGAFSLCTRKRNAARLRLVCFAHFAGANFPLLSLRQRRGRGKIETVDLINSIISLVLFSFIFSHLHFFFFLSC